MVEVTDTSSEVGLVCCPDGLEKADGTPHTVIGCGALIPDERDDEGLVDCPKCGIWFDPDQEPEEIVSDAKLTRI